MKEKCAKKQNMLMFILQHKKLVLILINLNDKLYKFILFLNYKKFILCILIIILIFLIKKIIIKL